MLTSRRPFAGMIGRLGGIGALFLWMLAEPTGWGSQQRAAIPERQSEEYAAQVVKTIVELQPFRQTQAIEIKTAAGKKGVATLINLNPTINVWYLLRLSWQESAAVAVYHLENSHPTEQRLLLDANHPHGLILHAERLPSACVLWASESQQLLEAGKGSRVPYVPLCEGKIYLRNQVKGHRTAMETATDFLRDTIWGGEEVIGFVRDTLFQDAYLERAKIVEGDPHAWERGGQMLADGFPASALLAPQYAEHLVTPQHLGIAIAPGMQNGMALGRWYAAQDNPGIYVSIIQPQSIAPEVLHSHKPTVSALDGVEAAALVSLIAFDLEQFSLGFALGTEHPRVGWSERVLDTVKDKTLPGPDGIGSIAPFVATGLLSPVYVPRTVATFTGGFKRTHGAFRSGALALKNHGSHYGFIENGVVFSKLQPGLATLVVRDDDSVMMQTWSESDNAFLARIKHARQNGVPLVAFDATTQSSVPGALVSQWGPGNWSGSQDKKLRTLRAGVCLQEQHGKRFLIYAYFSSATPSAMARVFQAYACRYAMLLDMNALEHTYLAVYRRQGDKLSVQHLIQEMSVLDKAEAGQYIPRFLGFADNRDFFYVMRREHQKATP